MILSICGLVAVVSAIAWTVGGTSDGLTDLVTWDQYSLMVNGSRVHINSGEFHYIRMPVPEMWLDIFQKFKANGFNAVSLYFFWNYHEASKGVFDFETSGKNIQRVLDYAKEAGLNVIARPGPYANAEINAGGLAIWGSDGSLGTLRTSDETYHRAWLPYVTKVGQILAKNQITVGGPVILNQIENELQETTHIATNTLVVYIEQIKEAFRNAGVIVPFTSNEKGERSESWSIDYENVGGAVNVYGLDSYPGGLSCTNLDTGFTVIRNYFQWFSNYSFTQPSFFPEFEGGYFQPWGGLPYDSCLAEHDPAFADVYYKNNIGQRTTMQNLYMAWGGTNWGHSAAPVVYSSYDYSAPLRETRQIQDKFYQTKLIGLFTRVSTDLLKTTMVGNGTGYSVSSPNIWTWYIQNPDTAAGFYTVQQATTSSRTSVTFSAYLNTSDGLVVVPNVNLNGRQSKILVTDYSFGKHALLYSTAEILTYGLFDVDVLVLYLDQGQSGQFAFKAESTLTYEIYGADSNLTTTTTKNGTQAFIYIQASGQTIVKFSNGVLLYLLDRPTAWKFWAPTTISTPTVAPNEHIFVIGPYLVRNATISQGVIHVSGDNNLTTTIEVYTGDSSIQTIDWNGLGTAVTKTSYGSIIAQIPGTETRSVSLPTLSRWKSNDSLPEVNPSYDDSTWIVCNKTITLSPVKPYTLPVLFSSDYGFYPGIKVYRGYFDGQNATSVNITTSGGLAFGWNAWVNGHLIGGSVGNATTTISNAILFLSGVPMKSTDNVITVVVDYTGHDETSTAKGVENPRGILGARLLGESFKLWKIQGNAGGSANLDAVRGPINEGGLYGERLGWHLPGFDASTFSSISTPLTGISTSGVQFYITTFDLNIDSDLDAPIGIELSAPPGTNARVQIFVNGYQFGKYVPQIGPQTRFPIPPGVINNRGLNMLALSLWAQTDSGAQLSEVTLVNYGLYQTDFNFSQDWSYLQPGWDASREQYA